MEISVSKDCIAQAKEKMNKAIAHLEDELRNFRAGKANPAVFNAVMVDYYGSATPLPQVASINTPDANLGFTPANNGETIRINVPALTEERRKDLVKQARTEGETAKVSVRNARREVVDAHKKYQKEGLPEDVCKDAEVTIQKETDAFNKKIDEIIAAKEKEIMTV